jgi:hypothetical protein
VIGVVCSRCARVFRRLDRALVSDGLTDLGELRLCGACRDELERAGCVVEYVAESA